MKLTLLGRHKLNWTACNNVSVKHYKGLPSAAGNIVKYLVHKQMLRLEKLFFNRNSQRRRLSRLVIYTYLLHGIDKVYYSTAIALVHNRRRDMTKDLTSPATDQGST